MQYSTREDFALEAVVGALCCIILLYCILICPHEYKFLSWSHVVKTGRCDRHRGDGACPTHETAPVRAFSTVKTAAAPIEFLPLADVSECGDERGFTLCTLSYSIPFSAG